MVQLAIVMIKIMGKMMALMITISMLINLKPGYWWDRHRPLLTLYCLPNSWVARWDLGTLENSLNLFVSSHSHITLENSSNLFLLISTSCRILECLNIILICLFLLIPTLPLL